MNPKAPRILLRVLKSINGAVFLSYLQDQGQDLGFGLRGLGFRYAFVYLYHIMLNISWSYTKRVQHVYYYFRFRSRRTMIRRLVEAEWAKNRTP